jgi:hypothetical protein
MHSEWIDRLTDYIDDELSVDERREVEAHLADCPTCAAACDDLTAIAHRVKRLPPLAPPRDLWDGIEARLTPAAAAARPHRLAFTIPQLLAASVVLAILSGFIALRLRPAGGAPPDAIVNRAPIEGPSMAVDPALPGNDRTAAVEAASLDEATYARTVSDLEDTLERDRRLLDPATIAVVEENLAIIDRAMQEARQALTEDPANSYLSGHVAQTRQRKIDLLRQATALAVDTH